MFGCDIGLILSIEIHISMRVPKNWTPARLAKTWPPVFKPQIRHQLIEIYPIYQWSCDCQLDDCIPTNIGFEH
jgi:hypothetical protein